MSLLKDSIPQQNVQGYEISQYSVIQIKSNKIIMTNEYFSNNYKRSIPDKSILNLKKKGTVTSISKPTKSKIEKMLSNWIKSILYYNEHCDVVNAKKKHTPVFITLTLPCLQNHSDIRIKREVLMPFVQDMKRYLQVDKYFWKAELQDNYNIHFHLIVDHYVDRFELQNLWNKHLNKLSYIDRFKKKFSHKNPPTTHVRKIDSLRKMISYVTKYVTKNEEGCWIDGRIWNCSKSLKEMRAVKYEVDNVILNEISRLIDAKKLSVYEESHFVVFSFTKEFNHNKDYSFFRKLEKNDYIELYHDLYFPSPISIETSAHVLTTSESRATQLAFEFEVVKCNDLNKYLY